ncbi:hypothetical protein DFH09DRAFT_1186847, partial [Mycena vulgaris]
MENHITTAVNDRANRNCELHCADRRNQGARARDTPVFARSPTSRPPLIASHPAAARRRQECSPTRPLLPFPHRYRFPLLRSCSPLHRIPIPRRHALLSSGKQARARAPRDEDGGVMDVALHVARVRWLGERAWAWGAGTGGVECSRQRGISAGEWCRRSARSVCAVRELEPGSPSR